MRPCVTARHKEIEPRVVASREHKTCLSDFTYARETADYRGPVSERNSVEVGRSCAWREGVWLVAASHSRISEPLETDRPFRSLCESSTIGCGQMPEALAICSGEFCERWSPAKGQHVPSYGNGPREIELGCTANRLWSWASAGVTRPHQMRRHFNGCG
jgi:hypothetical protein